MGVAAGAGTARRRRGRVALLAAAVVIALAGSGLIAYRVFRPAEVVTERTAPGYPAAAHARPGVIGTLAAAPLIVDGRLRVYATKRQIRADAPVDARTQRSPFWSYRRWPEQVVGVVATAATVVGRWSDGRLVAIDARTGRVAWRADGPVPEVDSYAGRRTGAATVYAPDGLYTAGDVVIVRGATEAVGIDVTGGQRLWRQAAVGRECRYAEFTTAGGRFATVNGCADEPRVVTFHDAATGRATRWTPPLAVADLAPLGCRVGLSECAGLRTTGSAQVTGWLLRGPVPARAPGLDVEPGLDSAPGPDAEPDAEPGPGPGADATAGWLAAAPGIGDVAVAPGDDGRLVGRRAGNGRALWNWLPGTAAAEGRARVIATQPGRVHLLTGDYFLVTVDAATGVELSRFRFTYGRERTGWSLGHAYAADGFVLAERLAPDVARTVADDEFYFLPQPVLLAGT